MSQYLGLAKPGACLSLGASYLGKCRTEWEKPLTLVGCAGLLYGFTPGFCWEQWRSMLFSQSPVTSEGRE